MLLLLSFSMFPCMADNVMEINLWPDGVPEDNGITEAEYTDKNGSYGNVTSASIFVSLAKPEKNTGNQGASAKCQQ